MRYIKEYKAFFDADQAVVAIGRHFSDGDVERMLVEERLNWTDNYGDLGNGEAEELVIEAMVLWYEKESKTSLADEERTTLMEALSDHYGLTL